MLKLTKKQAILVIQYIDSVRTFNIVYNETKGQDIYNLQKHMDERTKIEKPLRIFLDFYQVRLIEDLARHSVRFNWNLEKMEEILKVTLGITFDVE